MNKSNKSVLSRERVDKYVGENNNFVCKFESAKSTSFWLRELNGLGNR